MARFLITHAASNGAVCEVVVDAATKQSAVAASGIKPHRVLGIRADEIGSIKSRLTRQTLSIPNQAMLLSELASSGASGTQPATQLDELVAEREALRALANDRFKKSVKLVDKLKAIGIDSQAVTMASIGEQSGSTDTALSDAANFLMDRMETAAKIKNGLSMGITYLVVGFIALIGLPQLFVPLVEEGLEKSKGGLDTNILTDFLMAMVALVDNYWVPILIGLVVGFIFRARIWESVRGLPGFNLFWTLRKMQMGTNFMASFTPLVKLDMPTERAIKELAEGQQGKAAYEYGKILEKLDSGKSLYESFDRDEWPHSLVNSLRGYERNSRQKRLDSLAMVKRNLNQQADLTIKMVSRLSTTIGFGSIVFVVLAVIFGGFFPIMSQTSVGF